MSHLPVINPATGTAFAEVPDLSVEQVDQAVTAARRAFGEWRLDEARRREALRRAAGVIEAAAGELAPLLTSEQGKPLAESHRELAGTAGWLRYYADLELPAQELPSHLPGRATLERRPLGVIAAIAPNNFPVLIAMAKVASALRVGNTVVLKPSPYTPLATARVGELLAGVLPPGVLTVVTGGDQVGRRLTGHELVRGISFTGSTEVGRAIARAVAGDLKRLTLELGGNDPLVVLDDVDPADVAEEIFWRAFNNNGQACVAPKRIFVPEERRPAFVAAFAELATAARVGRGDSPDVQLGPLNNAAQRDRVAELVDEARAHGATVVTGGTRPGNDGYFYPPTIVTDVDPGERLVVEEQFGPVLPVVGYRSVDDAVTWANAGMRGLGSSVWGADEKRAVAVADRLDAGVSWINTHTALSPTFPIGGMKWSGLGSEGGATGLDGYSAFQTRYVA
ncbi:aldehyde dehydrogenase family protein [Actinoplanes sp. NPDC051411]|uniref:aldehyde dehydrogenase family protein n=1 Tax=Actinoplanes sp. NPDC051411 TaxID=3155522 RepID=UPI003414FB65